MVNINIAQPVKLKPTSLSKLSAFVSFDYDAELVSTVKELGTRVYLPDEKCWEIPESAVPMLMQKLKKYDVTLTGIMHHEEQMKINLPAGFTFTTKPYQHQLEGLMYGLENESFLLGDDQGLGKTKQIIDIALCRKVTEGMKHCLIICGINGTKYNWADEIKIHSSEDSWVLGTRYTKRAPVKMIEGGTKEKLEDLQNIPSQFFWITNIETLRGGAYKEGKAKNAKYRFPIAERIQELIDDGTIGMIAFDEAHKAKNPDSQQGRALLSIKAKHPIPMSGTFVLNNPLDLYLPLYWAGFEDHSFYQYKNHYCVMGGFNNKEVVGYKNLDELRSSLISYVNSYNQNIHSCLNGLSPQDRFFKESHMIKRLTDKQIETSFLLEYERRVTADNVITIDSVEYEVDYHYAKQRILIRYSPDLSKIYVIDKHTGEASPLLTELFL